MAKPKGHRANKANDSFGAINDDSLYRGKYRDEVYKDDDDEVVEQEAQDPSEEEATPEATASFAEPKKESDTDYKKRYDDLKRHYDSKLEEWKKEKEELAAAQQVGEESGISRSELPKTTEELEAFRAKYPDVYRIVETVSALQAESHVSELKQEVETIREREERLKIESAYKELISAHPDFQQIKKDDTFLAWLDEQPASIADGIYKNNTDAKWGIRVVDLYKADMGIGKKKRRNSDADPAAAVLRSTAKDVVGEASPDKKVWKASEIGRLKPWEFEKIEKEIDAARAEGRIDYRA
jgi:hypothetical protein